MLISLCHISSILFVFERRQPRIEIDALGCLYPNILSSKHKLNDKRRHKIARIPSEEFGIKIFPLDHTPFAQFTTHYFHCEIQYSSNLRDLNTVNSGGLADMHKSCTVPVSLPVPV